MNQLHTDGSSFSFWGLTGLAGAVSTTAVAVLLSAVVSTPAHSAPTNLSPAEPNTVTSVEDGRTAQAGPCFMGRYSWNDATAGPPPTCFR
jgi:hypothetical protein